MVVVGSLLESCFGGQWGITREWIWVIMKGLEDNGKDLKEPWIYTKSSHPKLMEMA